MVLRMPRYGRVTKGLVSELEGIVGSENVTTRVEEILCYMRDSSPLKCKGESGLSGMESSW